jgi:hypothetical protein
MGYNFTNRVSQIDLNYSMLSHLGIKLSPEHQDRLERGKRNWDFYDGFHWEHIGDTDRPQVTENYCRKFVDKMVAFEFGNSFSIKMKPEVERTDDDNDPLDFLNKVWKYNKKDKIAIEYGQVKSITGDGFIGAFPQSSNEIDDPFEEYPNGRIRILVLPSSICFPEYGDNLDKDLMTSFSIMFPIPKKRVGMFGRESVQYDIYRQTWTRDNVEEWINDNLKWRKPNKYKVIPIVHGKNFPMVGRNSGIGDLEDVIPLNVEINMKKSNVSEIIDYHSAPVTVVFGARVGQLERGVNKVWGGLPKDAKVENLHLEGDLDAAEKFVDDLKVAMHEVGGIPIGSLGGDMKISNTSGVALQIIYMPILERVAVKQIMTKEALQILNKIILKIGLVEKMITRPAGMSGEDFYYNEVHFEGVLPKDEVQELEKIDKEMMLGVEDRPGAMKRLGRDDIEKRIGEIDADRKANPALYGLNPDGTLLKAKVPGENKDGQPKTVNSGVKNSPEPKKK